MPNIRAKFRMLPKPTRERIAKKLIPELIIRPIFELPAISEVVNRTDKNKNKIKMGIAPVVFGLTNMTILVSIVQLAIVSMKAGKKFFLCNRFCFLTII